MDFDTEDNDTTTDAEVVRYLSNNIGLWWVTATRGMLHGAFTTTRCSCLELVHPLSGMLTTACWYRKNSTAVNEPSRVLFVGDWQNPPTRFNPFDDDATTLVDSSKSDCPSGDVQSHDGEKQCYHGLSNKRKAEPAAEHKQVARSGQLHPITECA